jgi:hypothetical protein
VVQGDAYRRRHCVVPIDSFFQKDTGGKRYAITRRDGQPFGVAGIWENWRDPLTGKWERTFAVVPVPANELVAQIHDRMLAILPNDRFVRWLSDEADPCELLVPFPVQTLAISSLQGIDPALEWAPGSGQNGFQQLTRQPGFQRTLKAHIKPSIAGVECLRHSTPNEQAIKTRTPCPAKWTSGEKLQKLVMVHWT